MKRLEQLTQEWKGEGLLLPIWTEEDHPCMVDQPELPKEAPVMELRKVSWLAGAIKVMLIRGSGTVGIAGMYGMFLEAMNTRGDRGAVIQSGLEPRVIRSTAVNLMKTVDGLIVFVKDCPDSGFMELFEDRACDTLEEQLASERQLGKSGAELVEDGDTILIHCHSGVLAGSGFGGGTLFVIRIAFLQSKKIHVFTCEIKPYLQGARITVYESEKFGTPHMLITDDMSGYLMKLGRIQKAVVGSDRVTASRDLINRIGTYIHAAAAKENEVPFYAVTSSHAIDFTLQHGMDLEVEFGPGSEVTHLNSRLTMSEDTEALYPAFDVTPDETISGIIIGAGITRAPYIENLAELKRQTELETNERIEEEQFTGLTAPTHHTGVVPGVFAKTALMPGDPLRAQYIAENYLDNVVKVNEIRCMYVYTGTYRGRPVSATAHGIGAPSMAVHAYELYCLYDVENIIRVGITGGLAPDLKLKDVIIAMGACYDTPYINQFHLSSIFSAIPSYDLLCRVVESAEKLGVGYRVGNVLSTDVFYPADDCQPKWKDMGILSVETETAALYIVVAATGKNALGILAVSDHIITGEKTTAEERQNSFTNMMEIALEMA